jgi:hypothetical protein
MSNEKKPNGGPAFPYGTAYAGMTLRDYFAAKAMQSYITADPNAPEEAISFVAYRMADAMLKARDA